VNKALWRGHNEHTVASTDIGRPRVLREAVAISRLPSSGGVMKTCNRADEPFNISQMMTEMS